MQAGYLRSSIKDIFFVLLNEKTQSHDQELVLISPMELKLQRLDKLSLALEMSRQDRKLSPCRASHEFTLCLKYSQRFLGNTETS